MMTPIKKASAGVSPNKNGWTICGSYHFSKELKCNFFFVVSQNRLFDITKSQRFSDITKSLFDITNSILIEKLNLILRYHKIGFLISEIPFFVITKSIFWYKKIEMILWYQKNRFCDITKSNQWYHFVISKTRNDFLRSQIRFCDITKSLFWYQEIHFLISQYFVISQIILWYHKIKFVISQNRISDITK